MQRVISYIDGFNLYFGLEHSGHKRYYWLDLVALDSNLLKDDQVLVDSHWADDARNYNELVTAWHAFEIASHDMGHTGAQTTLDL